MAKLINQDEAITYRQSIADPIIRGMVTHGHRLALLHGDTMTCDGDFDVLFFTKLLEIFFQDKPHKEYKHQRETACPLL